MLPKKEIREGACLKLLLVKKVYQSRGKLSFQKSQNVASVRGRLELDLSCLNRLKKAKPQKNKNLSVTCMKIKVEVVVIIGYMIVVR